jgi:hypothetical protein
LCTDVALRDGQRRLIKSCDLGLEFAEREELSRPAKKFEGIEKRGVNRRDVRVDWSSRWRNGWGGSWWRRDESSVFDDRGCIGGSVN